MKNIYKVCDMRKENYKIQGENCYEIFLLGHYSFELIFKESDLIGSMTVGSYVEVIEWYENIYSVMPTKLKGGHI